MVGNLRFKKRKFSKPYATAEAMEQKVAAEFERYLEENFDLTVMERQICVFLGNHNSREDVMRLLNLRTEAMKFHLKNIYAKLLPENITSRDKLHRLAILLWRIREKIRKNYA